MSDDVVHQNPIIGETTPPLYSTIETNSKTGVVSRSERSFRDRPFLIVFLVGVFIFLAQASWGYLAGEPSLLVNTLDDGGGGIVPLLVLHENEIMLCFFIVLLFAIVWIQLLRSELFVHLTLFGGVGLILVLCAGFLLIGNFADDEQSGVPFFLGFVCFVLFIILFIMLCIYQSEISFTVDLFKQGARSLLECSGAIFLGISFIVMNMLMLVFYLSSTPYILSLTSSCDYNEELPCRGAITGWLIFTGLFIWICCFFNGFVQCTIAGSVASHLYQQDHSGFASYFRAVYAIGSIAICSLVNAVVAIIKFLVSILKHMKTDSDNEKVQLFFCIVYCCVICLETGVKFISNYAYIFIAKDGSSFFGASKQAWRMIREGPFSVALTKTLSGIVMLIAKVIGMLIAVITSFFILEIDSISVSLAIMAMAYLIMSIACRFVMVAVDTVLICWYSEEIENEMFMNDFVHHVDQFAPKVEENRV
ncbi:hypothetical protein P9112_003087 [Eukaryota sp. TZLM1-RC]